MKCNRLQANGKTCGLRASSHVGIILRPHNVMSYAIEIGLQLYVCELHAESVTKDEILNEAHFNSLVDTMRTAYPYTAFEPLSLTNSSIVLFDIAEQNPIEPKGEG